MSSDEDDLFNELVAVLQRNKNSPCIYTGTKMFCCCWDQYLSKIPGWPTLSRTLYQICHITYNRWILLYTVLEIIYSISIVPHRTALVLVNINQGIVHSFSIVVDPADNLVMCNSGPHWQSHLLDSFTIISLIRLPYLWQISFLNLSQDKAYRDWYFNIKFK